MSDAQGIPNWLSRYVESAERVQKQNQARRAEMEAAQAKLRPHSNPHLAPLPRAGKKIEERRDQPHPLLSLPDFKPDTPHEVIAHFVESHHTHRVHAEEQVRQYPEAAAREHERRTAPHPLLKFHHLPIPERARPKRGKG